MAVKIRYSWQKPGSTLLYYRRRVPDDLLESYGNRRFLVVSLQTSDPREAASKIHKLARQHDEEFAALRKPTRVGNLKLAQKMLADHGVDPVQPHEGSLWAFGDYLEDREVNGKLPEPLATAQELIAGTRAYTLTDCRDEYIAARPDSKERAERAYRYLLEYLKSDRDIRKLRRTEVNGFVQHLLGKDLSTSSVQRYLVPLKASFARAIRENEMNVTNVFARVEIPEFGSDVEDREVFTLEQFKALDRALAQVPQDTLRSILLVLSETGARLAEIVGLAKADLHLKAKVPYIALKPHPWRSLKTPGSTRKIPLTPRAVECLQGAISRSSDPVLLYPHYTTPEGCKADTVSASLVKWVRNREGLKDTKLGNHSLRHGMKDLLRMVKCPSEAADQIIGHATPGMGANYGEGYSLEMLHDWIVAANGLKNH
jgi:integrase